MYMLLVNVKTFVCLYGVNDRSELCWYIVTIYEINWRSPHSSVAQCACIYTCFAKVQRFKPLEPIGAYEFSSVFFSLP